MTNSQQLLADYVRNGSEEAFRELVTRYLALVYSTAIRLVGGDTHLAEDVAQTVFVDLARKARTLPGDVMLGGWLHRDTCFVASKIMRGERRRQFRERHAVEMNSFQDRSESALMQVAPILDEAINQLGADDRTAILLRFFEQRDFRSVGEALGSNEDAARMRVNRALEKLHFMLKHRGVTLSVAALGTLLTAEAVTAAPVGLAVTISSVALAGAAAGTGTTLSLIKLMTMTKLQAAVIGAIVVVGVATPLVIQHQAEVRGENQSFHPVLSDDPFRRQTAREMHKWIENFGSSEATTLKTTGKIVFSWEELTASYPEQARILEDFEEYEGLRLVYRLKQHFEPIPARLTEHHVPDTVTIRKYGNEAYYVLLGYTNGVTYLSFPVPTKWTVNSQEEVDRQALLAKAVNDAARPRTTTSPEPDLQDRVTKIIVPEVNWHKVAPADCVSWLARESHRLDPDGEGVNFVLTDSAEHSAKTVTLKLRNVPLIDIIQQVTSQSGWAYQIDSDAVTLYRAGTKPPVPHVETPPPGLMQDKLTRIVLPEVIAKKTPIGDLLRYISEESRRVDPKGEGVNCVLSSDSGQSITFTLHNIPLGDLIKYLSQVAGLTYRFESNAVVFDKLSP